MINLDELLKDLGEFGRYQKKVFAIVCMIVFTSSWVSMIQVFLAASVDHWCATPQWDDFDCSGSSLNLDDCKALKRAASIPSNSNFTEGGALDYKKCVKYNVSSVEFHTGLNPANYSDAMLETIPCDQGWEYDTSQYKSSLVTDYDLVCGKDDQTQVAQSVFYGGFLVGSIVNGIMADRIGRWWTLMYCMVIRIIAGIGLAFAPNWWVYAVFRFLQGFAAISIYIISFIMGTEFVGPSKRNVTGIAFAIPFAIGYMLLALMAYLVPYWRTLQLIATAPAIFYIGLLFFMPESVRWQMSVHKFDQAEKTLQKIGEDNKKPLKGPVFTDEYRKEMETAATGPRLSGLDLFRTPRMRIRTINLIFNWMVNSMVYHGLSLNTSNLGVNDYVAFAVFGGVEIPAYMISVFLIQKVGRKFSLCGCLLLGGVACLCTTFIPPGAGLTTVAMFGKFGISASFAILYLYTAELYPTGIRSVAMGTCSMFSRIAGIIAPLILTLAKIWTPLPLVIYGSVSVAAGLFTLFLPETLGQKLPETLEDGENFGLNTQGDSGKSTSLFGRKGDYEVGDDVTVLDVEKTEANGEVHINPVFIEDESTSKECATQTEDSD